MRAISLLLLAAIAYSATIAERMREQIDKHEIHGAVTLVANKQKVTHLEAMGHADLAGKIAMRPDAIFWIASMTKPITATAILMLQEAGKLSIDDPASKYIPEYANLKTKDGKPVAITLRHMLTHTSGLSEANAQESRSAKTLAELIPVYSSKPVNFEPGSTWKYCQSGINSLGRIVEIVSGERFEAYLQKHIFEPLKMKDTTFYLTDKQLPRLVTPVKLENGALVEAPIQILGGLPPTSHDHYPAANGGLFSTASDYARFARMLLNEGTLDGRRYLQPGSVQRMRTIDTGTLPAGFLPGHGWGLGVGVVREPQGVTSMLSPGTFGHGGANGTQAWMDPVKGQAFILMIQRANFRNSDDSPVRLAFQEAAVEK
jgi:CubicO group peptidase (beta-lactamase class C family)